MQVKELSTIANEVAKNRKIIAPKIGWDEAGKLTEQIADAGLIWWLTLTVWFSKG